MRGVSLVMSETSEPVDSMWSLGVIMVLGLGNVRESESLLGLARFMLNTGGSVSG